MNPLQTLVAEPWPDWGLIDCGNGRKLERYGEGVIALTGCLAGRLCQRLISGQDDE